MIFLLLFAFGLGVPAQDVPPVEADSKVPDLLKTLAEDDFAARERATQQILALGPAIVPELRAAREGLPLEARLRVDEILDRLATSGASLPSKFEATRIDLELTDAPLLEVLRRLSELSGMEIHLGDPRTAGAVVGLAGAEHRRVTTDWKDLAFFDALDRLCADQDFVFRRDYRTGSLVLQPGDPSTAPVVYLGPLRATPAALSVSRSTRFVGPAVTSANLQVRIDYEDRARVIGILGPVAATVIEDEKGNDLVRRDIVQRTNNRYLMGAGQRRQLNISLQIAPPKTGSDKIAKLVVPLPLIVPEAIVEETLRDLVAPTPDTPKETSESPSGPLALSLDDVQRRGDQTTVTVSFAAPNVESDEPTPINVQWEEVLVLDADGNALRPVSSQKRRDRTGRQVRVMTVRSAAPQRVVVRCLARYRVKEVSLEMRDIAFP